MEHPQIFSRYHLNRRIARGGMAEVFLATQHGEGGFEKRVALKKILPMYTGIAEFGDLFRDEAYISAALNHSGIAQVLDYGTQRDEWYLVLEYVDGPDLEELLDRCRRRGILPPVDVVLYIGHRLASALEYAHAVGGPDGRPMRLVHRDVSPPNVLLGTHGEVKLTDFGVAKAELRSSATRPGVLRGKYAYMSPEQIRRQPVDHRSDLFSLGTVLYETLTGVNPFERGSDFKTMESVSGASVESAIWLRQDAPPELGAVLQRCLADDPDERYQDAGLLRRDLRTIMLGRDAADEPETMVAFLRDVFPDRAPTTSKREGPSRGSAPSWEGLAHRLSPMLVQVPTRIDGGNIRLGAYDNPPDGVEDTTDESLAALRGEPGMPPESVSGRIEAIPAEASGAAESGRHRRAGGPPTGFIPGAISDEHRSVFGPLPILTTQDRAADTGGHGILPDAPTPDLASLFPLEDSPVPAPAVTHDELPIPIPRWPTLDGRRDVPRHDTPISELSPVATHRLPPVLVDAGPRSPPALPGARVSGPRSALGPMFRYDDEDEDSVRTDPGFDPGDVGTPTGEAPALAPTETASFSRLKKAGAGGTFGGGFKR